MSQIRLAAADDRAEIEAIVRDAYSIYIPRMGREPGPMLDDYAALIAARRVHVVEADGAILGVVVLIPESDAMLLDNVAVRPEAKGRGYGRLLITFAERTTREAGYGTIRLYTHETMTENIALYEGIGFIETHRGEERDLRRVYMAKRLD